jgi:hypothetical protein
MRRSAGSARVGFVLIIGLLFCTLGTLELPELVNLTDNTSNDYSTSVFQNQKESIVKEDKQLPSVAPRTVLAQLTGERQTIRRMGYAQSLPAAQSDSLHFFCILRT